MIVATRGCSQTRCARTCTATDRELAQDSAQVIQLRELSRMLEDLQHDRVKLSNRLRQPLRRYFPQMLELTHDLAAGWCLDLWRLIPTPAKARHARASSIDRLLKKHRIRKRTGAAVLTTLRARTLTVAAGTGTAATTQFGALGARIGLVHEQVRTCQRNMDQILAELAAPSGATPGKGSEQRDVAILHSLPGVGRVVIATLLAEASQPLRSRDYHALRALCGTAPVTRQSGRRRVVGMRKACNVRLRNALYHWARVATQHDLRSHDRYAALRQRGCSHGRALRSVSDRLLAVACSMLRSQTLFDPSRALSTGAEVA